MRVRQYERQRWSELRYFLDDAPSLLAYLAACHNEGLAALNGMARDGRDGAAAGEHLHALKGVCDGLGLVSMKNEIEWARSQFIDACVAHRGRIVASLHASFEQDVLAIREWAAEHD